MEICFNTKSTVLKIYPLNSNHIESTTVETLLFEHIYKEKFFAKEPDPELYWLFVYINNVDAFDIPLVKDKKILKFLYAQEKE